MAGLMSQWRHSHKQLSAPHFFANVVGVDDDLGFGIMRVTRVGEWQLSDLVQPLRSVLLALAFEWGVALHGLYSVQERETTAAGKSARTKALRRKVAGQLGKDYVLFPVLSGRRWRRTLGANVLANALRNVWAYLVIVCGHFADGAEKFTAAALEGETKSEWYLRQMLGTANFHAGPVLAFMSGNLCYQIEHHLFPDLPSNRYREIAERVRPLCVVYDLPYTTAPLAVPCLAHDAHDLQIGASGSVTARHVRRRPIDSVGERVSERGETSASIGHCRGWEAPKIGNRNPQAHCSGMNFPFPNICAHSNYVAVQRNDIGESRAHIDSSRTWRSRGRYVPRIDLLAAVTVIDAMGPLAVSSAVRVTLSGRPDVGSWSMSPSRISDSGTLSIAVLAHGSPEMVVVVGCVHLPGAVPGRSP